MSLRSVGNPGDLSSRLTDNDKARDCFIPMGITSENVAERFGVSREKQDAFALSSQLKAARAQSLGLFDQEIVPVTTKVIDDSGKEREVTVAKDEGIRAGTTMEGLSKLRPAFKPDGSTTAGNSSQVSDGAAAVLVGRRSAVEALGLPVLGVLRASAVVGVPPDVMGIGPAFAIPAALEQAGLSVSDIDVFEINEAFASQAVYCVEKLGIPPEKVNPNGGAIALGHPLGCTGARQVVTLLNELRRRGRRFVSAAAPTTLCRVLPSFLTVPPLVFPSLQGVRRRVHVHRHRDGSCCRVRIPRTVEADQDQDPDPVTVIKAPFRPDG
ncbi:3-ketoacyl-CoA thiolase, peroxisomal isoform X1 [Morone saxatilis]|uniref:3-ketoacyl-CoA thiolase, peroxisomal isoform X1 n=1 Tax=Morone saxatilis TaxID=34816 RepID=UPI0015E25029|nr:3-ketoacyl-CoA thiolase, peroxisomal isoform X1 [Morone saxatilis]